MRAFLMSEFNNLFNELKPSGEGEKIPNDSDVTLAPIPENILAFRTITTLLAQLPRATQLKRIDYLDDHIQSSSKRRILKISDAFAHLAAAEHGVTAVTTNLIGRSWLPLMVHSFLQACLPLKPYIPPSFLHHHHMIWISEVQLIIYLHFIQIGPHRH